MGSFYSLMHAYSARVYEKLRELYPKRGPDLIEFADYLGEGLVTLQAHRTLDPALRNTRICVRTHTSVELARVLNGHSDEHLGTRALFEGERYSLANADRVIWQGGDILGTYQRFYGQDAIAEPVRVRNAVSAVGELSPTPPPQGEQMKFLYVGRLERRKGVQNLLRAVTALRRDDWSLTLVGGDSPTAPLGSSMREQLELMAADDPRIEFAEGRPRRELAELYASHHVLLSRPSGSAGRTSCSRPCRPVGPRSARAPGGSSRCSATRARAGSSQIAARSRSRRLSRSC